MSGRERSKTTALVVILVLVGAALSCCKRQESRDIPAAPSFAFADVCLYDLEDAFTAVPVSREVFGARVVKEYEGYLFEGDTLTLQYVQEDRQPQLVEILYLYLPEDRGAYLIAHQAVVDAVDSVVSAGWEVSFLPPPVGTVDRTRQHHSYVDETITYTLDVPVDSLGSAPSARYFIEVHAYDRQILERHQ